ncbi:hypothetical protein B0J14DRAFT_695007 [Halenospora varia]|nr:hypothetical protein B0J14DRAFT_695007 [Halenospora varia]
MLSFTQRSAIFLALTIPLVFAIPSTTAVVTVPTGSSAAKVTSISVERCPAATGVAYTSATECFNSVASVWSPPCVSGSGQCYCWYVQQIYSCYDAWCPGYSTRGLVPETASTTTMMSSLVDQYSSLLAHEASCAANPGKTPTGKGAGDVTSTGGGSAITAAATGVVAGTSVSGASVAATTTVKSVGGRNGKRIGMVVWVLGFGVCLLLC